MNVFNRIASWLGVKRDPEPAALFTAIKRPDGSTMLVDQTMLDYLQSKSPDPTQASLDRALERAERVRIHDAGVAGRDLVMPKTTTPLLEVAGSSELLGLRDALKIEERAAGHCMCHGSLGLEFIDRSGAVVALVGLHHGRSIRWDEWKDDALLIDGMRLLTWLAERGVKGPLQDFEEARRSAEVAEAAWERWQKAMPECLRAVNLEGLDHPDAHLEKYEGHAATFNAVVPVLARAYPDENARILALFRWYGSGEGTWTGYPSYEGVPEQLLMKFRTRALIRALESVAVPSPELLTGAARFFGGHCFRKHREDPRSLLSGEVRRRFREHLLPTADANMTKSVKSVFGSD